MLYIPTQEQKEEFLGKRFITITSREPKDLDYWNVGEKGEVLDVGGNFELSVVIGERKVILYPEDIKILNEKAEVAS